MDNWDARSSLRVTLPVMRAYPDDAVRQCGVFTVDQARRAGWTMSALCRAVRSGRLDRPRRGTYRVSDPTELVDLTEFERQRLEHAADGIAAALAVPGARASHSTAAVLHRLPLLFVPDLACTTVLPWYTGELDGVHLHRCTASATDVRFGKVDAHGVAHTVVDLGREHGVTAAVVAADHALHAGLTSVVDLERELRAARGWPGVRAARRAVDLADERSESPLESRSRLKLLDAGLAAPETQILIVAENGRVIARPDFYWDEWGVVGEADGALKYDGDDPRPLHSEKKRQSGMEDLGLEVVRWGNSDLDSFDVVLARLARARSRGARPGSAERRWHVVRPRARAA